MTKHHLELWPGRWMFVTLVGLLGAMLLPCAASAAGTTYYLDCSQGASGNGSQASP